MPGPEAISGVAASQGGRILSVDGPGLCPSDPAILASSRIWSEGGTPAALPPSTRHPPLPSPAWTLRPLFPAQMRSDHLGRMCREWDRRQVMPFSLPPTAWPRTLGVFSGASESAGWGRPLGLSPADPPGPSGTHRLPGSQAPHQAFVLPGR